MPCIHGQCRLRKIDVCCVALEPRFPPTKHDFVEGHRCLQLKFLENSEYEFFSKKERLFSFWVSVLAFTALAFSVTQYWSASVYGMCPSYVVDGAKKRDSYTWCNACQPSQPSQDRAEFPPLYEGEAFQGTRCCTASGCIRNVCKKILLNVTAASNETYNFELSCQEDPFRPDDLSQASGVGPWVIITLLTKVLDMVLSYASGFHFWSAHAEESAGDGTAEHCCGGMKQRFFKTWVMVSALICFLLNLEIGDYNSYEDYLIYLVQDALYLSFQGTIINVAFGLAKEPNVRELLEGYPVVGDLMVVVAEATIRDDVLVTSASIGTLQAGSARVTVLDVGESQGHTRIKIADGQWVSSITAEDHVLLIQEQEYIARHPGAGDLMMVVAEATIQDDVLVTSASIGKLKKGSAPVTILDVGESQGHTRIRIADGQWVSSITAEGHVLLTQEGGHKRKTGGSRVVKTFEMEVTDNPMTEVVVMPQQPVSNSQQNK